jgi:hypothetical protein
MPREQHDQSELVNLVNLMREHGVDVFTLKKDITDKNKKFSRGDLVIPLAQPYRAFIKEVMEKQDFPVRHYTPGGEIIKPYDITSWSLPLHNGVESWEINEKMLELDGNIEMLQEDLSYYVPEESEFMVFPLYNNESYKIAFRARAEGIKVSRLMEDKEINGVLCPKGSFVIKNSKNNLNEILNSLTVNPIYTNQKIESEDFTIPSIALVESWFHDMDAGWTRFVFDSYYLPFELLRPVDLKTTDLKKFDVIVFPNENKNILLNGKYKSGDSYYISSYAPEYAKGMEKEGLKRLLEYVNKGGKVVSWGQSTSLFEGAHSITANGEDKEEFQLPFRDISPSLIKQGVYCPGSLIRMEINTDHPIAKGMPDECGIFYRGRPLFSTSVPNFDMDRRVIGTIPEKNILMSGYCENEEKLGNKPVMIWLSKGNGEMILMGF